ncbi:MAG: ammonium transporter [Thermodesulfobacteriota bacterium]
MINTGDTAFIMISAAMVLLMTPALALFYAGMVRSKNVLGTILQSFIMIAVVTFEWIYIGYSMSFGPDVSGIIGDLSMLALNGVGSAPSSTYATTIPQLVFMIYQCMFAVITPALITGAFAERMRFGPFILFSLFWTIVVYNPVCHWIWGGGWLAAKGVLDFAGGLVVHLTSGAAAAAAVMVLGPRKGLGRDKFMPHSLPMTLLGTGLLWFGWFGFNGGSALAADGIAATAFVNTHVAGMAGLAMWVTLEWLLYKQPTTLGAASGAIAGLATVTPAAGFISPHAAVIIGLLAGLACFAAVTYKNKVGFDDSLDVVGIHGLGGVIGTICLGVFASKAINPGGADGLLAGNASFLATQIFGVVVVGVYAFVVSLVLLKITDTICGGLRVSVEDETVGLDQTAHSETAYNM